MRISRPLYEALPWVYIAIGVAAVAASFAWREPEWSDWMAVCGAAAVVIGLVLVLRRRDYRIQQRRYGGGFDEEED